MKTAEPNNLTNEAFPPRPVCRYHAPMTQTQTKAPQGSGPSTTPRRTRLFWSGAGLLVLTFLLYTLAFPPFNVWPAIFIALIPLGLCILGRPANWRWFGAYYLLGSLFFSINLFWLCKVTVGGLLALSWFCGLYFVLFAWGFRRLVVELRWPALFALPLVWVACEYLRSTVFSGFAWFLLGNATVPWLEFVQIADLFGVWGVSFIIAMAAGLCVDILRLPLFDKNEKRKLNAKILWLSATYGGILIFTIAYGIYRIQESDKTCFPGIRVTTVQEYIKQSQKDSPTQEQRMDTFSRHVALTERAAKDQPDLVVWSETIIPEYINQEWLNINPDVLTDSGLQAWRNAHYFDQELEKLSTKMNAYLLVGSAGWDPRSNDRQNLAILYSPKHGQTLPYYAKRHLVPFGEYIPFRDVGWIKKILLALTPYEGFDYSLKAGDAWMIFTVPSHVKQEERGEEGERGEGGGERRGERRGGRFGVPICYEDVMPYPARSFVSPQRDSDGRLYKSSDFLVSISNDGWYDVADTTAELDQHLQMAQMRAIENRVPIVRSVNGGNSGFVDSVGRVELVLTQEGHKHYIAGELTRVIQFDRRISLYSRIGDILGVGTGILSALAVAYTVVRPRRGSADSAALSVQEES